MLYLKGVITRNLEELRINVIFNVLVFPVLLSFFFNTGSEEKCDNHESSPNGFTPGCTSRWMSTRRCFTKLHYN